MQQLQTQLQWVVFSGGQTTSSPALPCCQLSSHATSLAQHLWRLNCTQVGQHCCPWTLCRGACCLRKQLGCKDEASKKHQLLSAPEAVKWHVKKGEVGDISLAINGIGKQEGKRVKDTRQTSDLVSPSVWNQAPQTPTSQWDLQSHILVPTGCLGRRAQAWGFQGVGFRWHSQLTYSAPKCSRKMSGQIWKKKSGRLSHSSTRS